MFIFTINCGSSSLKCQLYNMKTHQVVAKGDVERIALPNSIVRADGNGKKISFEEDTIPNHTIAINHILEAFGKKGIGILKNIKHIKATGHRVVHGGSLFNKSTLITDEVLRDIESISFLAPLHNPANIEGIKVLQKLLPKIVHVAVFDTAFHQSIPEKAYRYAIPKKWYNDYKVRRYGFHGMSHLYVSKRAAHLLGKPARDCNLITLHVGSGVSVTAIKNGLSVDTSMGMTPLEGAIMGTRCGNIDPSIPTFISKISESPIPKIEDMLNKKSGLLGITGKYSDRRDIAAHADTDDSCKLAIEMETYSLKKYIGFYMAVLDGEVDALVFTAGVGEKSPLIRERTLHGLEKLGIKIDQYKNQHCPKGEEVEISTPDSPIKVFVIPTDEEIVMTEDVLAILTKTEKHHLDYPYSFL